jgi:enamine deaminase RidA (YjgF/YER057c/UK114 family)
MCRIHLQQACAMALLVVLTLSAQGQNKPMNDPKTAPPKVDGYKRLAINLPNRTPNLPFSDAILVGDTLYMAGRIGIDPATGKVPAKVEDEVKFLLDGFDAVLRQAGMTMDDLVSVQIFAPDVSLWEAFNAPYIKRFSKELPARAFIGSGPLLLGGRFEMVGIAVKRQ